jgi:cytochrome c peroxidase
MMKNVTQAVAIALVIFSTPTPVVAQVASNFQQWRLPAHPPYPETNPPTPERIELGKMLFFDARLSGDGKSSCATCHVPELGWSDNRPVSIGFGGKPMARNSPSLVNGGYNTSATMWAGQKKSLEDQVGGPMSNPEVMATDIAAFAQWMENNPVYQERFARAYPGEPIGLPTISKAIANYERTIVSLNSPFDQWLAGNPVAMTPQQIRGFAIFVDEKKGNCAACHLAPTLTDNGYHNIGLASKDIGRYKIKPIAILKGAFKTPQLRDVEYKAPYMHDGSIQTLMDVVEHYNKGGDVPGVGTVSMNVKPLNLSQKDKEDLVAFLKALSSPMQTVVRPVLPKE